MVLIDDNIYCKGSIFEEALNSSLRTSHLIRRLMAGIFNPTQLENVTASVQAPRAIPIHQKKENYELLHPGAKKVIIDYALNFSNQKNWEIPNRRTINAIISQRLTELKLQNKHNVAIKSISGK